MSWRAGCLSLATCLKQVCFSWPIANLGEALQKEAVGAYAMQSTILCKVMGFQDA